MYMDLTLVVGSNYIPKHGSRSGKSSTRKRHPADYLDGFPKAKVITEL